MNFHSQIFAEILENSFSRLNWKFIKLSAKFRRCRFHRRKCPNHTVLSANSECYRIAIEAPSGSIIFQFCSWASIESRNLISLRDEYAKSFSLFVCLRKNETLHVWTDSSVLQTVNDEAMEIQKIWFFSTPTILERNFWSTFNLHKRKQHCFSRY